MVLWQMPHIAFHWVNCNTAGSIPVLFFSKFPLWIDSLKVKIERKAVNVIIIQVSTYRVKVFFVVQDHITSCYV